MQQTATGNSITSTTVERAEVGVGGVNRKCTPGQQCITDSINLKARPVPTAPAADLAAMLDLGDLTCLEMVVVQLHAPVNAPLATKSLWVFNPTWSGWPEAPTAE